MFNKALIILASISSAFAVPFITQPVASTTFQAGTSASVRWENKGEPSLAKYGPCLISIYVGNAMQQTSLQTLSRNIDVSKESELSFTPNASIGPNSNEYFIRIESLSLKDPDSPQYPALAFSSKFTLAGMTGTFNTSVQNQIKGQSTAPLALPGASSTGSGSSPTPTVSGISTSRIPSSTALPSSSTGKTSAAESIGFHSSWIGFLLSTIFGAAML